MRFRLLHHFDAAIDVGDVLLNQLFDLFCCRRRVLRQITDLCRHNGKTTPGLPGPRGFNRGIERQNISLESNTVDNADDVDYLPVVTRYRLHHGDSLFHNIAAFCRIGAGFIGHGHSMSRSLSSLLYRATNFFNGGSGLLQVGGGFF